MSNLLELKDIGKVYVSEGTINIGIRNVDLSFNQGEVVAITGKSGSGKSTLLNVISGIDSYEEGELYIEGKPTSHYSQEDWEQYREKYISFIFQDYNIIDSFTVLENVELSLISIQNEKEKRNRAIDLIKKVGLMDCINQKGSKLSGGQKQRTVIARALAKDSPIILADEPTGNLDSKTSEEIINLLKEISKDKLLIIVTHNFEQVEHIATRHIRIHDGSIEFDKNLQQANIIEPYIKENNYKKNNVKNSIRLALTTFKSKPKLSIFICFLLIIGTIALTITTSSFGDYDELFDNNYVVNNIDGRVIITKNDGTTITDDELLNLKQLTNADSTLHYDYLLDIETDNYVEISNKNGEPIDSIANFNYNYECNNISYGKYPQSSNEIALKLPISKMGLIDQDVIGGYVTLNNYNYTISGISFYKDNNITPTIIFNTEGFYNYGAIYYCTGNIQQDYAICRITSSTNDNISYEINDFGYDYTNINKKITISDTNINQYKTVILNNNSDATFNYSVTIIRESYDYSYYYTSQKQINYEKIYTEDIYLEECKQQNESTIIISYGIILDFCQNCMQDSYKQASIFYTNDTIANKQIQVLKDNGYFAISASSYTNQESLTTIMITIQAIANFIAWIVSIIVVSLIIYLCLKKSMDTFKNDIAIMRSMGISIKIIKSSVYIRILISTIPSLLFLILYSILVANNPVFNSIFSYLYFWQYLLIFIGIILISLLVSRKLLKRLFNNTIKKTLTGGNEQ